MGTAPITEDADGPRGSWALEVEEPDFFVVDDQWHEDILDTKVECDASLLTGPMIQAVMNLLHRMPDGHLVVAVEGGALLLFPGRVLTEGSLFENVRSFDEIVHRARGGSQFGRTGA